jgi:diadenosine tetraphosphate (Ap4A) HIT family hydrolase
MTDLPESERARFLQVVFAVETVLRSAVSPDKVNLACLGNLTPHLHWHVIPRYADDPHFPQPIWAAPLRAANRPPVPSLPGDIAHALDALLSA